jgi:hypothetical protein
LCVGSDGWAWGFFVSQIFELCEQEDGSHHWRRKVILTFNLVWSNSSSFSGIGLALAKQAAARGYNLILADINEDCLESAKKVLNVDPNSIQTKVCDVSKENEIRDLADFSFAQFGEFSLSCFPRHFFPYPHL